MSENPFVYSMDNKRYHTLNYHNRMLFGEKIYKAVDIKKGSLKQLVYYNDNGANVVLESRCKKMVIMIVSNLNDVPSRRETDECK